jgi:hypothetical protein
MYESILKDKLDKYKVKLSNIADIFPDWFYNENISKYLSNKRNSREESKDDSDGDDHEHDGAVHQVSSNTKIENVYTRDPSTGAYILPTLIDILRETAGLESLQLSELIQSRETYKSDLKNIRRTFKRVTELHMAKMRSTYNKKEIISKKLLKFRFSAMQSVVQAAESTIDTLYPDVSTVTKQLKIDSLFRDKEPLSCSLALAAYASYSTKRFKLLYIDDGYSVTSLTTAAALQLYRTSKPVCFNDQQSVEIYTHLGNRNRNSMLVNLPEAQKIFTHDGGFLEGGMTSRYYHDQEFPMQIYVSDHTQMSYSDRQELAKKFPNNIFLVDDLIEFLRGKDAPTDVCLVGASYTMEVLFLHFWLALTNPKIERLHVSGRHSQLFCAHSGFGGEVGLLSQDLGFILDNDVRRLRYQSDLDELAESQEKYILRCYDLWVLRKLPGNCFNLKIKIKSIHTS